MVSARKEFKIKVWDENNLINGQIMFTPKEWGTLTNEFRDLLVNNVMNSRNLELLKDEGYPKKSDSNYLLFKKDNFEEGRTLLRKFREKYPDVVVHPGLLHFLFKTKKYRQHQEYSRKRATEEEQIWKSIDNLFVFDASTNHDYPEVCVRTKMHNKEELGDELQKVAQKLNVELEYIVPK